MVRFQSNLEDQVTRLDDPLRKYLKQVAASRCGCFNLNPHPEHGYIVLRKWYRYITAGSDKTI